MWTRIFSAVCVAALVLPSSWARADLAKDIRDLANDVWLAYETCHMKFTLYRLRAKNYPGDKSIKQLDTAYRKCAEEQQKIMEPRLASLKALSATNPKATDALKDFYSSWTYHINNLADDSKQAEAATALLRQKLERFRVEMEW